MDEISAAVERLEEFVAGRFAYTAYRGQPPSGVPTWMQDLRTVLVALAKPAGGEIERAALVRARRQGVRDAVTWLHAEAKTMNDPHARSVLNNAAFHLGSSPAPPTGKGA